MITFCKFNCDQERAIKATIKPLTDQLKNPIIITLKNNKFQLDQQHAMWYGGEVVSILYKGWKFAINAFGDIRAWLIDKSDGHQIFYVKDRNNMGDLGSYLRSYIKTDTELQQLLNGTHPKYHLETPETNWWECTLVDPADGVHEPLWSLDADNILGAIAEVIPEMDNMISEYGH